MCGKHLARDLVRDKQQCFTVYDDLGLDLVGLIGNFWIVEQLLHLVVDQLLLMVVEQLLNSILSSNHVSKESSEAFEMIHILFCI